MLRVWTVTAALATGAFGWDSRDVGYAPQPGSASYDTGTDTWTVRGDGHDIGDNEDAFHFVFKALTGDGEIIARVHHIDATSKGAKAGLMIRETLEPASKYAFMALTPYGRTIFQYRDTAGHFSSTVYSNERNVALPHWLKLVREGNTFAGYYSINGRIWISQPDYVDVFPIGASNPTDVSMRRTVYVGLAVTSQSKGVLCRAEFDSIADSAQPDLHIRNEDELDYAGDNVYDGDIARLSPEQVKDGVTGRNMAGIWNIRIQNDGPVSDRFTVFGLSEGGDGIITYTDVSTGTDVTGNVSTAAGWTSPFLAVGATADMTLTIAPGPFLSHDDTVSVLVRATSSTDRTKVDTVKAISTVDADLPTAPWGRTYATFEDFERGVLRNVECAAGGDRLQLSSSSSTLPFIWVPNTNEGTVSKLDTRTGRELGRYRVCPEDTYGSPSRTTVDRKGNCWVGNRGCGTVVKIGLLENGQYEDRNENGVVETSRDLNSDGQITDDEILPWGQDECVLREVVVIPGRERAYVPGQYTGSYSGASGPRGIAVDPNNNLWAGCFSSMMYYHIDGDSGEILRQLNVSTVQSGDPRAGHTPYGAVVDANGILWSSGHGRDHVLRLDSGDTSRLLVVDVGHFAYGLGLHRSGYLFVSGYGSDRLSRIRLCDPNDIATWDGFPPGGKGVACTDDGDVWIAHAVGHGLVTRCTQEGEIIKTIRVGRIPTGVAVDAAGKVWVVDYGDAYVHRIDPNTNEVDLSVRVVNTEHYGYSDMTGHVVQNYTTKTGAWTVLHSTRAFDATLGGMWWDGETPNGTSLAFLVRSSNDRHNWSLWQEIDQCCAPCEVPPGRYFEVRTVLEGSITKTPALHSLSLCFQDPAECMPDYSEWAAAGKPPCWCRPRQCYGDADGVAAGSDKTGHYFVGPGDLNVLLSAWLVREPPTGPGIDSVPNGICADFAHDRGGDTKTGLYRVGPTDLNVLVNHWLIKEPPEGPGVAADCLDQP